MSAAASWRDVLACSGTRLAIGAVAVSLILYVHWAVGLLAVPLLYGIEHLVRRRLARPAACLLSTPRAGLRPAHPPRGSSKPGAARRLLESGTTTEQRELAQ